MANIPFTKRRSFLPDIKNDRKNTLDSRLQMETTKTLGPSKTQQLSESYLNVRGHIVPGCSQVQSKSSESSGVPSEGIVRKKGNSKLRTMKVQPISEKISLMEKFESSLKERLLSSAHFSKQIPLFDGISSKEKTRKIPTSLNEDDMNKNESMFNAVFPARKDTIRCGSPWLNEKLFSKHNRESQDWLKQIESENQDGTTQENKPKLTPIKNKSDLKKTSNLKKIKKTQSKTKEENIIQTEIKSSGPLEQLKFLSSPRLSSRVGEKGSSRSKIAKEKYSTLKLNSGDNQKLILPKLSSKNISKEASKNVILENQISMEFNALEKAEDTNSSQLKGSKVNKTDYFQNPEVENNLQQNEEFSKETLKDLSEKKLSLYINSSSDFSNVYTNNMEVPFKEVDVLEGNSGEQCVGATQSIPNFSKGVSQSTSLEVDINSSFSNKSSRLSGTMGGENPLMREYNILYFETVKDISQKSEEEVHTTEEVTPAETSETLPEAPPELLLKEISDVSMADDSALSAPQLDDEEEELPKEVKEGEEDCTAEPCNEPQWFEDYGIDKKSRKEMGEEAKSEESLEGEYGEVAVVAEEDIIQEVVQDDEVLESKKKKVKKIRTTVGREREEEQPIVEEVEELESETVREIKTIPLVTLDLIPEKERPVVEIEEEEEEAVKPIPQMPSEYLKKYVGKHLVAGLAQVALFMPSDPVEYLAHWLIKERKKETLLEEFKQFKNEVKSIRKINIDDLRRKLQMDYLQNEAIKKYQDSKHKPLYPTFNSSESEFDMEEGGELREEEFAASTVTEHED